MKFAGFVGPTNVQRSRLVDAERSVNWYMEGSGAGTPKASYSLQATPGLRLFTFLGAGNVRGLFGQDGRAFGVGGAFFYEIFASRAVIAYGQVRIDGRPATMASNGLAGHQLMVTSGGLGYIFDLVSNTFTQITDDGFPTNVASVVFFDGYFIVLNADTGSFHFSSLEDGMEWNALDVGMESQFSDKIVAMTRTHDNLWLFGTRNTAPWYNSGDANTTFAPIQGTLIEHGIGAAFSAVELDDTVYYMGRDSQGGGLVWRANGYQPVRVSTTAIEYMLSQAENLSEALAYSYQEQGHLFYVLYVPSLPTTPVYDVTTNQWHERAHWDPKAMRYFPHVAVNHMYIFDRHLVGDRQSGAVYEQSLDFADDRLVI